MPGNNFRREIPSNEELAERLGRMSPTQATRYFNRCTTNINTPDEVLSFLRDFRKANPDKFASDSSMMFQRNKGLSYETWSKSEGFRRSANKGPSGIGSLDGVGMETDAYDYLNEGGYRNYRPRGQRAAGVGGKPAYVRRERKPASEERSMDEIQEIMKGLGSNIRRTQYYKKVMANPESNKETKINLDGFRTLNPELFATDSQIKSYKKRSDRPYGEARTPKDVEQTMFNIRSRGARTRYFMKVIGNAESNETTKKNLVKFRNDHPELFITDEQAMRYNSSRAYASPEEFGKMSGKAKHFFTSSRGRSRAQNSAYALKVITNPSTSSQDRGAMVSVIRRFPQMFFGSRYNNGGKNN
ncbi:MAG: hypothetical protein MJZ68_01575 [archaeon]|nr:hypothetical protein [archaeon]